MQISLHDALLAVLYGLAIVYCFLGLSAITDRFFRGMENIVQQTRQVTLWDPGTGRQVVKNQCIWNYAVADITLLALGTSFPQISLATIDACLNLGNLYAGGLGPGTLVGSAACDLFLIHALCIIIPPKECIKKVVDRAVWAVDLAWSLWAYIWLYIILLVWTPEVITIWEAALTVLQFFILVLHAYAQDQSWPFISITFLDQDKRESWIPPEKTFITAEIFNSSLEDSPEGRRDSETTVNALLEEADCHAGNGDPHSWGYTKLMWRKQFEDALDPGRFCSTDRKQGWGFCLIYEALITFWKLLFAFVPPPNIYHGWVAFISSLVFITGISYGVTQLTTLLGDATGVSEFVIALTVLATGASWPDLAASAIAAYRQSTADSAIANITCSNSVNIFIGIGVPWVINTVYNRVVLHEELRVPAHNLRFILLVYFITFVFCVLVLIARRHFIGGELGGPRKWAWASCIFILLLWMVFLVLSCLHVYSII